MDEQQKRQVEANKALEEAINNIIAAYGMEGFLMEWVVLTASHIAEDDGTTATAIDHFLSDDLPIYRMNGLLDFVLTQKKHEMVCHSEECG